MPAIVRDIFEDYCKKEMQVIDAIAVNSGTSALIASLWALDLQPGDEVITTPFTFIATTNAILIAGGTPVFVDIDPDTLLIDVEKIAEKITDRTRAIIPVHLYGRVCDVESIMKIAYNIKNLKNQSIIVIEDAAQAFGATENDYLPNEKTRRLAGTIGDIGCFSFYKTKNISTFEGGMIVVNSDKVNAEKVRAITDQGQIGKYQHKYIGFNFRLAEPLCLLGLEAMKLHMTGIKAELGMRGPEQGHYPNVVYEQEAYIQRGITGNCPIAEKVAKQIKNKTYKEN